MTTDDFTPEKEPRRDYTGLVFLALVAGSEIGILYVLIAVKTPLTPIVTKMLRDPFGVFTLVVIVVTFLCYVVAWVLRLVESKSKTTDNSPSG
jgi:xanthosine utilization system XapX-like protein